MDLLAQLLYTKGHEHLIKSPFFNTRNYLSAFVFPNIPNKYRLLSDTPSHNLRLFFKSFRNPRNTVSATSKNN